MIIKSFEANKINISKNNIILMYGKNEGFKRQLTDKISSKFNEIETYEEKEVLDYSNNFLENILNKSLCSNEPSALKIQKYLVLQSLIASLSELPYPFPD